MNNLFNKTKEVTIEEFVSMWNKGGSVSYSQYSNGDKRNYLFVSKDTAGNEPYCTMAVKLASNEADFFSVPTNVELLGTV